MDKLAEALVELVKAGGPLAAQALWWHYTLRLVDNVSSTLLLAGLLGMVAWALRRAFAIWKQWSDHAIAGCKNRYHS